MNLVLSIVQNEDAEPVTRDLLAAGHRVTRINYSGRLPAPRQRHIAGGRG